MPSDIGLSRDYSGFDGNENTKKSFGLSAVLNKRTLVIILFLCISVIIPILLYLDIFDEGKLPAKIRGVCLVDNNYRIPCGKTNISEKICSDIYCCFEKKTNSCYHNEPSSYFYYQKDQKNYVSSQKLTPLGLPSTNYVQMSYTEYKESLSIVLSGTRSLFKSQKSSFNNFDVLNNENNKLSSTVYRKNTTEMLLTTLKGPLIINKDYLEWTIQLTNGSGVLFGLGGLKIDSTDNSTITKIIYKNKDDHNTLPMFMAYNKGKYHAVIVQHEGALEVTVLPSYLVCLRTLYTNKIEIQVIDGPYPKDIYDKIRRQQQPQSLFDEWIFGVHICREQPVKNVDAIVESYNSFVSQKKDYPEFTYESECIHDDLLLHLIAENYTDGKTTKLIKSLGISENFVLSYPPQIPIYSNLFQKFKNSSVFFKNSTDGTLHVGKYRDFDVVYPIYNHIDIQELVQEVLGLFQGVNITGLTFTNSWPQDDTYLMKNSTDLFVDKNIQDTFSFTIPWNLTETNDIHARFHNNYGPTFASVVEKNIATKFTLSPVSHYNSNRPLITQNLNTSWTNLKTSLRTTLFNSVFGRNFLAVPVCGSNIYDQIHQEDLCLRWYLMAATMPLVRVSSTCLQRTPVSLYTKYTNQKVISVLDTRRSLVPYYRGVINEGSPLVRSMFFNFPKDEKVHKLDEQYMVGDALLVAQPMSPDIAIMNIYLPPKVTWYEFWGGEIYNTTKDEEWIKFPIVKTDWISFILAGHIIPQVKKTTNGPEITLRIAMKCGDSCKATGTLMLEQLGDVVINFSASGENITVTPSTVQEKKVKDMIKTICMFNSTLSSCEIPVDKYIIQEYHGSPFFQ
ncbi:alpha-glucosidase-like [Harmonia axyridis]|uniref:alpha-glucosidase-like n=1 Tax=Harmonia axyridis TaxID=115357 RepID=UPI001E27878F|nr:alpha-glucosidase-like [Harmonia axyridis]